MTAGEWRDRGLCADLPADDVDLLFYGGERGRWEDQPKRATLAEARSICDRCPVWAECLEDALRAPSWLDEHGLRGGLLPGERRTLRTAAQMLNGAEADPDAAAIWIGGDRSKRAPRTYNTEQHDGAA